MLKKSRFVIPFVLVNYQFFVAFMISFTKLMLLWANFFAYFKNLYEFVIPQFLESQGEAVYSAFLIENWMILLFAQNDKLLQFFFFFSRLNDMKLGTREKNDHAGWRKCTY